jgi:hypothetical protein
VGNPSLLKSISVGTAGKLHPCRCNKAHLISKGDAVFIIKQGREEHHYCLSCGLKFIATAQTKLASLEAEIRDLSTT